MSALLVSVLGVDLRPHITAAVSTSSGDGLRLAVSLPQLLAHLIHATGASGFRLARKMRRLVLAGPHPLFYLLTSLMLALGGLAITLHPASLESTVASAVRFILLWGLVAWVLHDYGPLLHAFDGGFDTVANTLLAAHTHGSGLALAPVRVASRAFLHAVGELWRALPLRHLPALGWDLRRTAAVLWIVLLGSILLGLALVALLAAWLGFLGIYFMAEALTAVAVALGPLLIICLLVPYLSELAHGWFRFLLGVGFYKIVAAVIVALIVPVLTFALHETVVIGQTTLLHGHGPVKALVAPVSLLLYDCAVLLAVGFILLLLRQIPSIVQHLLSGRGSSGQGVWSGGMRLAGRATDWIAG
ncbi:MAG: type IV secretion system protein [Gammaproteobacteria bacterium]|jgi:hypothetical protein|nr:type IV secretion system protein [Gammaproteobacteria bacterium]